LVSVFPRFSLLGIVPKLDVVGSTPIARSITLPSFAMLNGDSKEGWVG